MGNLREWIDGQSESDYSSFEWGLICEMSRQLEMQEYIDEQFEIEKQREDQMQIDMYEMMEDYGTD